MNRCPLLIIVLATLVFGGSAAAQRSVRLGSTPKAFQTFYTKFRAAVAAGDKEAVAAMTVFPFKYGFDAGDEGTFTRRQFTAKFGHIFGTRKAIFTQRNPVFYPGNGSFELIDEEDASHYVFSRSGATYKFRSYMSEP